MEPLNLAANWSIGLQSLNGNSNTLQTAIAQILDSQISDAQIETCRPQTPFTRLISSVRCSKGAAAPFLYAEGVTLEKPQVPKWKGLIEQEQSKQHHCLSWLCRCPNRNLFLAVNLGRPLELPQPPDVSPCHVCASLHRVELWQPS